jgi:hypothetical protein
MRRILTITLSALMLAGCADDWKSPRTGPRWTSGPNSGPIGDQSRTDNMNLSATTGQFPP